MTDEQVPDPQTLLEVLESSGADYIKVAIVDTDGILRGLLEA